MFFNQQIYGYRPATRELRDGSTVPDRGAEQTIIHPPVNIQSGGSSSAAGISRVDTGEATVETITVYGPPGVPLDVQPGDRFRHDGVDWKLATEQVRTEYDPITGAFHHHWFVLQRWEGGPSRGR